MKERPLLRKYLCIRSTCVFSEDDSKIYLSNVGDDIASQAMFSVSRVSQDSVETKWERCQIVSTEPL